jgi:hypothetical protein
MVRSHHNESPVPETRTLHPERRALALTVAAVLVGCGAASTPARYAERPLLTPDDEHTLVVVIPAGFSSEVLPFDGGWRYGLSPNLSWEVPTMLAWGPGGVASNPSFVLRGGISAFGVVKDEVPGDDPRASPKERTRGLTVLRAGVAGRFQLTPSQALVPVGNVDHTLQTGQDHTTVTLGLTWLSSAGRHFSFAPGVRLVERSMSVYEEPRGRRVAFGHVGSDGGLPYALVSWHATRFVDLGIGGAVSWDPNHTSEVEADAAVNVEFRWD